MKSNDLLEPIILNDSNLSFSVEIPGGILNILELQVPGKRKIGIQEFLRGNSIEGWKLL
jgi:methionyl-tRNA formyltransferase